MRVPFDKMKDEFKRVFLKYGLSEERAEVCARVHAESSRDGVYSHGSNRVERFVDYIKKGYIDVNAEPRLIKSAGVLQAYDGNFAPGILNALFCVDRAIEIAGEHGMGLVSVRRTHHWQRGGTYGHYAAQKGFIIICWTNTSPNMPAWGGLGPRLGNNPFVMAVPSKEGPVVLDMAMSLYSYGKMQTIRLQGKKLTFPAGFDEEGNFIDDPLTIETALSAVPMGYWKGASFSFMLDIIAAITSDGENVAGVDKVGRGDCGGISQVFIVIDPQKTAGAENAEKIIKSAKDWIKSAAPLKKDFAPHPRYPGEGTETTREENMRLGIPVDDGIWAAICAL